MAGVAGAAGSGGRPPPLRPRRPSPGPPPGGTGRSGRGVGEQAAGEGAHRAAAEEGDPVRTRTRPRSSRGASRWRVESATTFHRAKPPLLSASIAAVTAVVPLAATATAGSSGAPPRGRAAAGRRPAPRPNTSQAPCWHAAISATGQASSETAAAISGRAPARMASAALAAAAEAQNRRKEGGRLRSAMAGAVTTVPSPSNGQDASARPGAGGPGREGVAPPGKGGARASCRPPGRRVHRGARPEAYPHRPVERGAARVRKGRRRRF